MAEINPFQNIPEINFANSFRDGIPTNCMSTFGTLSKVGGLVDKVQTLAEDTMSGVFASNLINNDFITDGKLNGEQVLGAITESNLVKDVTNQAMSLAGNTTGAIMGSAMGLVMNAEQTVQFAQDLAKLFLDDMTAYATEVVTYLVDTAVNFVIEFPVGVTTYAAKYSADRISSELGEIVKQLTVSQDLQAQLADTESLQEIIGNVTTKINNVMGNASSTVMEYVNMGVSYINMLSSYITMGEEWIQDKVDNIELGIKLEIGKVLDTYIGKVNEFKDTQIISLGTKGGDFIADKTIALTKKPLQEAVNLANQVKSKAITTAKVILQKAILTLMSLMGG